MPDAGAVPTCSTAGVLGPVAGAVALRQVALGLSLIGKAHDPSAKRALSGQLDLYDGKTGDWTHLGGRHNSECVACGVEADDPTLRGSAEEGRRRCRT